MVVTDELASHQQAALSSSHRVGNLGVLGDGGWIVGEKGAKVSFI